MKLWRGFAPNCAPSHRPHFFRNPGAAPTNLERRLLPGENLHPQEPRPTLRRTSIGECRSGQAAGADWVLSTRYPPVACDGEHHGPGKYAIQNRKSKIRSVV